MKVTVERVEKTFRLGDLMIGSLFQASSFQCPLVVVEKGSDRSLCMGFGQCFSTHRLDHDLLVTPLGPGTRIVIEL